jgi:hypothetical protein
VFKLDRKDLIALIVLSGFWFLAIVLINPVGEFSLNDDWNYNYAVMAFLKSGSLIITSWNCATSLTQIFLAVLIASLFGFSFTALRLFTACLGLLGGLAFYLVLRKFKLSPLFACLGAMTVLANPIYLNLSNTFMTDIPFLALTAISFVFAIPALLGNSFKKNTLLYLIWAVVATMVRQLGVIISFGFSLAALAYVIGKKDAWKDKLTNALIAISPVLACQLAVTLYRLWLNTQEQPICFQVWKLHLLALYKTGYTGILMHFISMLFASLIYLGAFALPFVPILVKPLWKAMEKKQKIFFVIVFLEVFVLTGVVAWLNGFMLPGLGNIVFDLGLGPLLLPDMSILKLSHWEQAPSMVWLAVTACALISMSTCLALGFILWARMRFLKVGYLKLFSSSGEGRVLCFSASTIVVYLCVLAATGCFDRYLLSLSPLVLLFVLSGLIVLSRLNSTDQAPSEMQLLDQQLLGRQLPEQLLSELPGEISGKFTAPAFSVFISIMILFVYAGFGICGTHDYLSWNRARWQGLNYLTDELKISPEQIDGGFEFNGWYYTKEHSIKVPKKGKIPKDIPLNTNMSRQDLYLATFGPVEGYKVIGKYDFERWLMPRRAAVYLLKKERL